MLPIALEVPADSVSLSIVRQSMREIAAAFPSEPLRYAQLPSELPGLQLIQLQVPSREQVYKHLLAALTRIDTWARMQRVYPPLYDSHVRYEQEPIGSEVWQSTPAIFARGLADCEDLSCDLSSSYQLAGVAAHPKLQLEAATATGDVWHVIVEFADGRTEDPSRRLGME